MLSPIRYLFIYFLIVISFNNVLCFTDQEQVINKCADTLFDSKLKEEEIVKTLETINNTAYYYYVNPVLAMDELKRRCDTSIKYHKDIAERKWDYNTLGIGTLATLLGLAGFKLTHFLYCKYYTPYKTDFDKLMSEFKTFGIEIKKRTVPSFNSQTIYHDMVHNGDTSKYSYGWARDAHSKYMELYKKVDSHFTSEFILGLLSSGATLFGSAQILSALFPGSKEEHKKIYERLLVIKDKLDNYKVKTSFYPAVRYIPNLKF